MRPSAAVIAGLLQNADHSLVNLGFAAEQFKSNEHLFDNKDRGSRHYSTSNWILERLPSLAPSPRRRNDDVRESHVRFLQKNLGMIKR